MNHFLLWNANFKADIPLLAHSLCASAQSVWNLVSILCTDESVFAWDGTGCPVRHYIPRKPHPNGLLAYCTCTWTYVAGEKMPVLWDVEPHHSPDQVETGPHACMLRLLRRIKQVRSSPIISFHLFLNSHRRILTFPCITLAIRPLAPSPMPLN